MRQSEKSRRPKRQSILLTNAIKHIKSAAWCLTVQCSRLSLLQYQPPILEAPVNIELEVLFDNDKAIVKPEYYEKVQTVADFMNQYSNTSVTIEGHTDSNASARYNQQLSERRANAIKHILVTKFDIAEDRLSAIGYGEQHPRATNETAAGRQLNRRVIAVIQERD